MKRYKIFSCISCGLYGVKELIVQREEGGKFIINLYHGTTYNQIVLFDPKAKDLANKILEIIDGERIK